LKAMLVSPEWFFSRKVVLAPLLGKLGYSPW
jgi:hypothetical protein